jgi:hypothetical protein
MPKKKAVPCRELRIRIWNTCRYLRSKSRELIFEVVSDGSAGIEKSVCNYQKNGLVYFEIYREELMDLGTIL